MLNKNKVSQKFDISIRIIKDNADNFSEFLRETVNSAIKTSNFPSSLKIADITPLHKKGRKNKKENYRPVNILLTLSKIFEIIFFELMSGFFDNFLSEQQCCFSKGYSTHHCLSKSS